MLLWMLGVAVGATLPGLTLDFEAKDDGTWVLPQDLPEALAAAGAKPGWRLSSVDGLKFEDALTVRREVARGPAREVRLHFELPNRSETILVTWRAPLVQAESVEVVPWPEGVADPGWEADAVAGTLFTSEAEPVPVSNVFWTLSTSTWAVSQTDSVMWGTSEQARDLMAGARRVSRWKDAIGDHLLVPTESGVEVYSVQFPRGTALLPICEPQAPETCLTSGRQIVEQLADRPGALEEAQLHLNIACESGVYSACYEAVALSDAQVTADARRCIDDVDLSACNAVSRSRQELEADAPTAQLVGLMEYACTLEGSGTLGQRLRRLEDVGEGCMMLSDTYDTLENAGQALLALDQACVLGRAEACDSAAERRHQAFAARTVRECENEELAIAPSCVEQGRLLQVAEIPTATLDEFGAFLRGCALGSAEGCLALGDYVDRWGIDNERVVKAETELRASCGDGELRACLGAGHLLVRHDPKSEAYGEALTLFDRGCEGGLSPACIAGAKQRRIRAANKVEAPEQDAMWSSACELNDPEGCAGLGERHERSKATWPDAYAAWTSACELGDAASCSLLGDLVDRKHDPAWENEQTRDVYLARGCDNGDPVGCFWLADDQMEPRTEPEEATYLLLEKSCDGDHGDGCAALADVHLNRKTNFDDEIAARHLDSACMNGHYDSCRVLGTMYLRGKGVERDRKRANELLERFRSNAQRKHVRLGISAGMVNVVGGELELVAPIPVGPALSIMGQYSYIPTGGTVLVVLEGDSTPTDPPDLTILGAAAPAVPEHPGAWSVRRRRAEPDHGQRGQRAAGLDAVRMERAGRDPQRLQGHLHGHGDRAGPVRRGQAERLRRGQGRRDSADCPDVCLLVRARRPVNPRELRRSGRPSRRGCRPHPSRRPCRLASAHTRGGFRPTPKRRCRLADRTRRSRSFPSSGAGRPGRPRTYGSRPHRHPGRLRQVHRSGPRGCDPSSGSGP